MLRPVALVVLMTACAASPKPPVETVVPSRTPEQVANPEPAPEPEAVRPSSFSPVYFGFDSATLDETARRALDSYVDALRRDPSLRLTIEGFADERGSEEYNLALGERRAAAVRKYLRSSGVDDERLSSTSFGEERPADPSSNDAAWARNRRAEFVAR